MIIVMQLQFCKLKTSEKKSYKLMSQKFGPVNTINNIKYQYFWFEK